MCIRDRYLKHLFDNSENIVKRDTSVMYYDCTNYFFETEKPDEDGTTSRKRTHKIDKF